jgi:putative membrane protein
VKKAFIWIVSILVPVLVAVLYFSPKNNASFDLRILPKIYASINFITAIVLVMAFRAIKQKKIIRHRRLMVTALGLSVVFLILYVIYHSSAESVKYGGEGMIRYVYYFILISHILLSIIIVPLVLITLSKALGGNYEVHRKWARWTWPIWMYVAITGVLVYLMISPYY